MPSCRVGVQWPHAPLYRSFRALGHLYSSSVPGAHSYIGTCKAVTWLTVLYAARKMTSQVVVRLQGVIGLASLSSAWLSMHVVLGGLAAAALAAHDTVVFGLLELRQAPDYLPLLLDVPCHVHASLLEVQ